MSRVEELKNLSESADILNTHYVILNEVKNLLTGNTLSMLSMVGFEGIATSGKPSSQ